MKKRRPNNAEARMVRYSRAMLRSNHVAVIDVEASNLHTLINWKKASAITTNARKALVDAVCDIPHHWTIYLAAIHRGQGGECYMKSTEVALQGVYLAKHLESVLEEHCAKLRARCNPNHLQSMAWIATPYDLTLDEAHAGHIFEMFGAWTQPTEA